MGLAGSVTAGLGQDRGLAWGAWAGLGVVGETEGSWGHAGLPGATQDGLLSATACTATLTASWNLQRGSKRI